MDVPVINLTHLKKIHTIDTRTLPYPAGRIWQALADVSRYPEWWPASVKTRILHISEEIIGSRIEVRPYGGPGFFFSRLLLRKTVQNCE